MDEPRRMTAPRLIRRAVFALFLICAAVWVVALAAFPALAESPWLQGIFLGLVLVVTWQSATRALPVQNVLAVSGIVVLITSMALLVSGRTEIPFGPRTFSGNFGWQLFDLMPWTMPVIWLVAFWNARGVSRLILRPWRKVSRYGYWNICLTVVLTVLFDFMLEPFATKVAQWWIWRTPDASLAWHTAPWMNFLGWTVTTIIAVGFVVPWLINKRAGQHSRPDYWVLGTWLALNLLPAAGCALHQLWSAAAAGLVISAVVAFYAVRGARW